MAVGLELVNGGRPDGKNETDLVDEIGNVVDEIGGGVRDGTEEVAEEVARGVDGPADGDDGAHGVEGLLDGLGGVSAGLELASFTVEDFLKDEAPAAETQNESHPGVDAARFAEVAGQKHEHGTDEEAPEDATGSWAD